MTNIPANRMAMDSRGLDDLKRSAGDAPDKALRAAATQFEALFMNMILKSMRDGLPKEGMMSSSAGDTYTGMLDQQLSQKLSAKGTGLADMLVKQLGRNLKAPTPDAATSSAGMPMLTLSTTSLAKTPTAFPLKAKLIAPMVSSAMIAAPTNTTGISNLSNTSKTAAKIAVTNITNITNTTDTSKANSVADRKREFVSAMSQHAKAAEAKTGVPASFMLGQAALETGWGRREIKDKSGQPAFNVFGIKATGNWAGPTVDVLTTEFVNGVASKVVEKFRAYASYAESFADYAKLIADSPRYANVVKTARDGVEAFAEGLQRAGYATDPAYAKKLIRVINDAIRVHH